MRLVRDTKGDWHELNDKKRLLPALLASIPVSQLPQCRLLSGPSADPRLNNHVQDFASVEIRDAIEQAERRLAEATATAAAELRRD